MDVRFKDPKLDRLETDPTYDAGFSQAIVTAYRSRMQVIRAAPDERVFYNLKSLHFEKLKGNRMTTAGARPVPRTHDRPTTQAASPTIST